MKKSQILAALALAFALGVVAPVVTVSDTYAFTTPNSETHTEGKATKKDVETVVAAIKAEYPLAERMNTLDELVNGTDRVVAADDLAQTVAGESDAATRIFGDLVTNFAYSNDNVVAARKKNLVGQINDAITAAEATPDYTVVTNFIAADTDAKLQSAIAAFNGVFGTSYNSDSSVKMADKGTIAASIETTVDTTHASGQHVGHPAGATYDNYVELYNAVVDARTALNKYTTGYNALHTAITADGVLTDTGLVELGTNDRATNPTIAALLAIANDANDTNNMTGWNTFYDTLAGTHAIDSDSNTNYNTIIGLTTTLKSLAKITTKNPVEIAKDLLQYKGTVAPLPEKPADKEDDKKLPNAGNTGTIAGADATAKATVSIMAAIASVATAAFVAIRKIAAGKKA